MPDVQVACRGSFERRTTRRGGAIPETRAQRSPAFTLLEMLVVIGILTVMMAIMMASLAKVRAEGRSFVCKNQLKNIAFDFIRFADDYCHPWRGGSDDDGKPGFYIEDFQERQYRIDEFWEKALSKDGGSLDVLRYKASEQAMVCPAGSQLLERSRDLACWQKAVTPVRNVSIGFNMRLHCVSDRRIEGGRYSDYMLARVRLSKRIKDQVTVPLAFDVDGEKAASAGGRPYYSAPSTDRPDSYANGAYWYPSLRHAGRCNAAFIGGHVLSSPVPESGQGWNWKYAPLPEPDWDEHPLDSPFSK